MHTRIWLYHIDIILLLIYKSFLFLPPPYTDKLEEEVLLDDPHSLEQLLCDSQSQGQKQVSMDDSEDDDEGDGVGKTSSTKANTSNKAATSSTATSSGKASKGGKKSKKASKDTYGGEEDEGSAAGSEETPLEGVPRDWWRLADLIEARKAALNAAPPTSLASAPIPTVLPAYLRPASRGSDAILDPHEFLYLSNKMVAFLLLLKMSVRCKEKMLVCTTILIHTCIWWLIFSISVHPYACICIISACTGLCVYTPVYACMCISSDDTIFTIFRQSLLQAVID